MMLSKYPTLTLLVLSSFGALAAKAAPADPALLPAPREEAQKPPALMVDSRWELQPQDKKGQFRLLPYKPVFILGAFHANSTNETPRSPNQDNTVLTPLDLSNTETKFQLSLKSKLWQNVIGDYADLWFGYTQSSRWQVFNARASRPFRETDYEPEIMMAFRTNYSLFGWQGRMATAGFNHQSNGRDKPLSRSWNRLTASASLERGSWVITLRPWVRVSEDPNDDDNSDIEDFMGRGDVMITHTAGNHELSALLRHSLRGGDRSHGAAEVNWAFPIHGRLRGYVQVFRGYGESLIDYNRSATYYGFGVSLMDWYEPAGR